MLATFKVKDGHCNAPNTSSSEYYSLSKWYNTMRSSYKKIQESKTPLHLLSQGQIRALEALDFEWSRFERLVEYCRFY